MFSEIHKMFPVIQKIFSEKSITMKYVKYPEICKIFPEIHKIVFYNTKTVFWNTKKTNPVNEGYFNVSIPDKVAETKNIFSEIHKTFSEMQKMFPERHKMFPEMLKPFSFLFPYFLHNTTLLWFFKINELRVLQKTRANRQTENSTYQCKQLLWDHLTQRLCKACFLIPRWHTATLFTHSLSRRKFNNISHSWLQTCVSVMGD